MGIIEELEDLAENWEKTAETYQFRLDTALRDNADLAAEKQALEDDVENWKGGYERMRIYASEYQAENKRLLALIDEADHEISCAFLLFASECDCFKSKARGG